MVPPDLNADDAAVPGPRPAPPHDLQHRGEQDEVEVDSGDDITEAENTFPDNASNRPLNDSNENTHDIEMRQL